MLCYDIFRIVKRRWSTIIQMMIERGSSTDGAGAQSPLVERAQKIH